MRSEIKDISSSDVDQLLEHYKPEEEDNFGFILIIDIGIVGEEGADMFQLMLCTPKWLIENMKDDEFVFGYSYMIVFEYDYEKIYKKLEETFCIEGENWDEIGNKLNLYASWEFFDYKEYNPEQCQLSIQKTYIPFLRIRKLISSIVLFFKKRILNAKRRDGKL